MNVAVATTAKSRSRTRYKALVASEFHSIYPIPTLRAALQFDAFWRSVELNDIVMNVLLYDWQGRGS